MSVQQIRKADFPAELDYKTMAWDGKFLYGAYSTLISSWYLKQNPFVIGWLQQPEANQKDLDYWLPELKRRYSECDYATFEAVRISATGNHGTSFIFDECRDFCLTNEQNAAFMQAMPNNMSLKPVDNYYDVEERRLFQFNAHRGLYHSAYEIPQNSLAAIFNAYLAGIRSVEFDVLETKDYVNIVIHDLVTNRLDGSFDAPPKYVALWSAINVVGTPVGILDPLADVPTVRQTEVQNLVRTRELLWAVHRWMPELTLYADARNSAPVSLLKLLYDEPALKKNLVIKIYPFELGGGAYDVIAEYATRHTDGDKAEAIRQLRSINANLLLAMNGLPNEVAERTTLSTSLGVGATLSWDTKTGAGDRLSTILPYSTDSKLKPKDWPSYNRPWGATLFSDDEIKQIQGRAFLFTRWALDFSSFGTVRVFQIGLTPSLVELIDRGERAVLEAIPAAEKFGAAVIDNFIATFLAAMRLDFVVTVPTPDGRATAIKILWHPVVFGTSDRFPDFAFAQRSSDGSVKQDTLQNFYYSMNGTVYEKDDYSARLMRSTEAICDAMISWPHQGPTPEDRGGYITTDLPTDLRTMQMGVSGTQDFPLWMHYRVGGMIKAKFNPDGNFTPKKWSTELFGRLRREYSDFEADYQQISRLIGLRKQPAGAFNSLQAYYERPEVIVNKKLLDVLNAQGWYLGVLPDSEYVKAGDALKLEFSTLDEQILGLQNDFAQKYRVNYDGTPVRPLTKILLLPEANWDH